MMKPNLDKETTEEYYPHVMFIKNMADSRDFSLDAKSHVDVMYKKFFQLSKLKIYPGHTVNGQEKSSKSINYFVFPEIDIKREYWIVWMHPDPTFTVKISCFFPPESKLYFRGDKDINALVEEFRRRVFMSPKNAMQISPTATTFTEKSWSTLATNVWDSHKSNYFLRKYETFKEKEWSTNR